MTTHYRRSDRRSCLSGWRRGALAVLLLAVLAHLVIATIVHAQVDRSEVLGDKIGTLETRTAVLESEMSEVIWLGRGVLLALIGQMAVLFRVDRRKRPRISAAEALDVLRRSPGGDED